MGNGFSSLKFKLGQCIRESARWGGLKSYELAGTAQGVSAEKGWAKLKAIILSCPHPPAISYLKTVT